jgi:hypothetical protein
MLALVVAVAVGVAAQASAPAAVQISLEASFLPPRAGAPASVAVTFTPSDPDVRVNEEPPPRLKLDPAQAVLVYQPPAASKRQVPAEREALRYLEPAIPYGFPVTVKAGAPKGEHRVKASVTYFYCSKTAGWCRKGTGEVDVPVTVR